MALRMKKQLRLKKKPFQSGLIKLGQLKRRRLTLIQDQTEIGTFEDTVLIRY